MSLSDPIADFLTRVRNAQMAAHDYVDIPASTLKLELARVLSEQGYIESFSTEPARVGQVLRLHLKYAPDRSPVISQLERASSPGRRTYVRAREVPKVLGGMGTAIMSTSRGVMTGHDARRANVGGEVLAYVW